MKRLFATVIVLTSAVACQNSGGKEAMNPRPTATEVFHLRSECATLGQKMGEKSKGYNPRFQTEVLSHYDSQTGRCFVRLTLTSNPPGTIVTNTLYDGQTGEKLASSYKGMGEPSGEAKRGLLPSLHGEDNPSYKAAEEWIEKMMADDRNR